MEQILELVRKENPWHDYYNSIYSIRSNSTYGMERRFISGNRDCFKTTLVTRLLAVWSGSPRDSFDNKCRNDPVWFVT